MEQAKPKVDADRFRHVQMMLSIQSRKRVVAGCMPVVLSNFSKCPYLQYMRAKKTLQYYQGLSFPLHQELKPGTPVP